VDSGLIGCKEKVLATTAVAMLLHWQRQDQEAGSREHNERGWWMMCGASGWRTSQQERGG
jgi:hypothetical protein